MGSGPDNSGVADNSPENASDSKIETVGRSTRSVMSSIIETDQFSGVLPSVAVWEL